MQNYAEVLEGYLIPAEEGFGDALKKVSGAIGKGFRAAVAFIKKILGAIGEKIKAIFSSKKENAKDAKERLENENAELKKRIKYLEDAVASGKFKVDELSKKNDDLAKQNEDTSKTNAELASKETRAKQMISDLKEKLEENEEKYKNLTKSADVDNFTKFVYNFISVTSSFVMHAYSELPKIVESARAAAKSKSKENPVDFDDELFYSDSEAGDTQWLYLYKTIKHHRLPEVREAPLAYVSAKHELATHCRSLVIECNKCIDYLEKLTNSLERENNPLLSEITRKLCRENEFIARLRSSVSLVYEIVGCFAK